MYSFISEIYLENNPAKNEVTADGQILCSVNNKPYHDEGYFSVNWA